MAESAERSKKKMLSYLHCNDNNHKVVWEKMQLHVVLIISF